MCVCVLRINNSTLSLGKFISFKTKYKITCLTATKENKSCMIIVYRY